MTDQTEYTYDVFISYNHQDEEWVTGTLLPRLEEAGLRVCIDYRDFTPGKPALLNMQDAAKNSRHTVLVLTPAWVASKWTLYESLLIRTDDPAGLQRRTVPLRLQPCELPEFISVLTWVDFSRADRLDISWTQLLTALGAPPAQEAPKEPTREEWCLKHPYPMPPNFTGRAAEREMLSQWLETDPGHRRRPAGLHLQSGLRRSRGAPAADRERISGYVTAAEWGLIQSPSPNERAPVE